MVYDAASRGNLIPKCRRNVTAEDEGNALLRNDGISSHRNAANVPQGRKSHN